MRSSIRYIMKSIKSVRFTAVIILLLIVIYFLGLVLPQKWMFDTKIQYDVWLGANSLNRTLDALGLTDVYLSPITIVLLSLFFLNLLIVTFNRMPQLLRKAMLTGTPPEFTVNDIRKNKDAYIRNTTGNNAAYERVKKYLTQRRWYLYEMPSGRAFHAVKNRLSPVGFLLFHMSFLLCLIGGLLITYTRFSGKLVLTEGQAFENDIRQFYEVTHDPKVLKMLPSLGLLLEDVKPAYEDNVPTELVVTVDVKYWDDIRREVLKVNEPIIRGPVSIIADNIGVSPLFVVRNRSGKEVDGAYVSLDVLGGKTDRFHFDLDDRYIFTVGFFPDYVNENGLESTRSIEIRNPAVHLEVTTREKGSLFNGTIRIGDRATIGPYSISFEDTRYWVDFLIVREYGRSPLIGGFVFAAVGLIMRLVFYQKRIRLAFESNEDETVLYIDGRSEYFGHTFRSELAEITSKIERTIADDDDTDS